MTLCDAALLVTGTSGYVGRVVAAELLATTDVRLLLPVRSGHDEDGVVRRIAEEHEGLTPEGVARRVQVCGLPSTGAMLDLMGPCRAMGVSGLLHAAGSVSYFDRAALTAGNETLTTDLLELGRHLDVEGFAYLSTAFSSGYITGEVAERLPPEPERDPTDYTASKRACEHLVAASGLPWHIARPAVVVGDSRTGRYSGRPYGIYQLWRGFERLLADAWQSTAHAVASDRPLQLVHQDAVARAVVASLEHFQPGEIVNLVSEPTRLPTAREAWDLWFDELVQPAERHIHPSVEQADRAGMSTRQRLFLDFTSTNLEIAEHPWRFETTGLARLMSHGLCLPDATLETLAICQRAFVASSPRLRAYLRDVPRPPAPFPAQEAHVP